MNDTYQLVTLTNGITSLCETSNQETFHPGIGPAAEAETLYVGQLHIAQRLAESTEEFIVWDVGLGAAANAIGALRAAQGSEKTLHIVSFDCTEGALPVRDRTCGLTRISARVRGCGSNASVGSHRDIQQRRLGRAVGTFTWRIFPSL